MPQDVDVPPRRRVLPSAGGISGADRNRVIEMAIAYPPHLL
ncbi:MAG: hypothetical protein WBF34_12485 [Streptosporangiaceae bacterium]